MDFPIKTKRLTIEKPAYDQTQAIIEAMLASKAELQRWMNWAKIWPSHAEIEEFHHKSVNHWRENARHLRLNAFINGQATLACSIGITIDNPQAGVYHMSYWANSTQTNKGYTTEAVKAVIRYLFKDLEASSIITGHAAKNRASKRVIEKCGFVSHTDPREDCAYILTP